MTGTAVPTFGLLFVLGLRHGLDPDHVAVIDNIVFRTVDRRPRLAGWTGTLFATGHSLAVAAVALAVALLAGRLAPPTWVGGAVDLLVVALLFAVGTINLAALLRGKDYIPVGWRGQVLPASLRTSTRPLATVAVGVIFGLVFDTATQAAAWGAAATAQGGLAAAAGIAAAFALGMILADTCDSQIVSHLLRSSRGEGVVIRRYRRAVGWLIVALSYGMGMVAAIDASGTARALNGWMTAAGIVSAVTVALLLMRGRSLARRRG